MAAAELSNARPGARCQRSLMCTLAESYLALWASTIAVAGLCTIAFRSDARAILGLHLAGRLAPAASATRMLSLVAHNLPIAGWPLLLGRMRITRALARRLTDALVLGCALANIAPVALAIGGYGTALLPYVPQLPVEWAALAAGYGSWAHARRSPLDAHTVAKLAVSIALFVLAAASLETFAVPHP
jgi:hypothetical protein